MWLYPDGSRILELSTKCAPAEMFQVAAEARGFLGGRGIDLSGRQQTKTKTALQQFSKNSRNWLRLLDRAASVDASSSATVPEPARSASPWRTTRS